MWYAIGFSSAVVLLALVLLVRGLWENGALRRTDMTVVHEQFPSRLNGLKIAHLSDVHNKKFTPKYSPVEMLKGMQPDLIVITGDLVDRRHAGLEHVLSLVQGAVQIAPVYFVTGNHEGRSTDTPELLEKLTELGVVILRDQAVKLYDGAITLVGIDDVSFYPEERGAERAKRVLSALPVGDGFSLLLTHRPNYIKQYAEAGVSLVCCGHAHGGQVRILGHGVLSPDQGFFPKYTAGEHREGGTCMVVSRGVGNSLIPIRLNNRPEIILITLTGKVQ